MLFAFFQTECLVVAQQVSTSNNQKPRFLVYASDADAELRSSLYRVLRGDDKVARIEKADALETALSSDAEVLVLILPQRNLPNLDAATLNALKKRKIVGIGQGAAQLFGKLDLEINLGGCAHGVVDAPMISVSNSQLLGEPKHPATFLILQEHVEINPRNLDYFAMFVPSRGEKASVVDVLARWENDANYAPVVRQGNCVLIGVPLPTTNWTTEFRDLICKVCDALCKGKVEPFSAAQWKVTDPGIYEFTLSASRETDQQFDRSFYFQFDAPRKFTARLDHAGSDAVMLFFAGDCEDLPKATRRDAATGETLQIIADISQDDLTKVRDRYWKLNVTNFGGKAAKCKLTIKVETP
jgi:hypothetical protein